MFAHVTCAKVALESAPACRSSANCFLALKLALRARQICQAHQSVAPFDLLAL